MSIVAYAPYLGKNVILRTKEQTLQGQLVGIEAWGTADDPEFTVKVFGQPLSVRLANISLGAWTIGLTEVGTPIVPEPEVNTVTGMEQPQERSADHIILRPTEWTDPTMKWELYIPPTRSEHFVDEDYEADVLEPHGPTYWGSLTAAIASLSLAVKNGDVQYNDGRAAS